MRDPFIAQALLDTMKRGLGFTLALGLALPPSTGAQSVPALSGRYRFVLTVSPSCPASTQVGPFRIVMDVSEAPVGVASEVSGQSASTAETPDNGRFVLLRQGTRIHGAFGASTLEHGLHAEGPYRVWMQIMTDGTVAAVLGGRARASGTAFGEVELSFATAGVKRARYVRVEDGELFPCPGGTLSEGADLDAVEALGIAGPGQ